MNVVVAVQPFQLYALKHNVHTYLKEEMVAINRKETRIYSENAT